ncbi:MAG: glycosyltransferase family 9 protein [Opitutaceae bacterium]
MLSAAGWLVAHAPESGLRALSAALGEALLRAAPGRRRLILSNLHHAFPDRGAAWRLRTARASSRRLVETVLLSLATPHLSEARVRRIAHLGASAEAWAREWAARGRPVVLGTLHLALWESQTWLKLLSPVPLPEFGVIFRPLDSGPADAYVKATRERFGMWLLSRKEGFAQAIRILREGGGIGVLFDQNAGERGALTIFLGRVCSTTELPGLLAARFGADLRAFYPRRTGFWRVCFETRAIDHDGTVAGMTLALNRWLEGALAADDNLCASWLWAHNRWRNQDMPHRRLRLEAKRNLLCEDLGQRKLSTLPRGTRIWVRLPNWLGDVVMVLPLIRALRASRPDAEITVFARNAFRPLLDAGDLADVVEPLPERGFGYWRFFRRLRARYPDVWIAFTHSPRGDLEGWLAGAPQRFGIRRHRRSRPLLTHAFRPPPSFREAEHHQTELWEMFLRRFGLEGPIPRAPALRVENPEPAALASPVIGLIAGSENHPAKRWPVPLWRALVEALPNERFALFGTAGDCPVTAAIAAGFPPEKVEDLAGRTGLADYISRLERCSVVVANDTGGMHLANALGVPLVALFGPTNPIRTGPIFAAPLAVLQPPGCPPQGGAGLDLLPVAEVVRAVRALHPCLSLPSPT